MKKESDLVQIILIELNNFLIYATVLSYFTNNSH